jgi:SAM-dependent methyltransferase
MENSRHNDGSAGDVDYGVIGVGYARHRRPDPRIAECLHRALGDARSVLNVGAGAGSYEPTDRAVSAIEPSAAMRAQRPSHLTQAIDAVAEALPFPDDSFDASMTTFSVHQWSDVRVGLREMRRVTRGPVLVLTCDPDRVSSFWLDVYAHEVLATEARRYPPIGVVTELLGRATRVLPVPIPLGCTDGFNEAYYGRPERLLDDSVRRACSAWSFLDAAAVASFESKLRRDLSTGLWDSKYGHLRNQTEFDGALRLVVGLR